MAVPWLLIAVMGLAATEVYCQFPHDFGDPPPLPVAGVGLYQGVLLRTIPNYAMLAARDFSDRDAGSAGLSFAGQNDGTNDGLWCQSANNGSDIGSWQFPDGSAVPADFDAEPIHMANATGQVGLLRVKGIGTSPYQGMYTCTILDENGVYQELVVWVAGNAVYDGITTIPIPFQPVFKLPTQSRDTDPPEFTLSFDVSLVPPTNVTCQVNSIPVDAVFSPEVTTTQYISSSSVPVTNVTVTLRTRQAGDYMCIVSVFRASGSTLTDAASAIVPVTVTDTPLGFIATRIGLQTAQTSWTAPASSTPTVEGYEVFYEIDSGVRTSGGTTTQSQLSLTLSSLEPDISYIAFVVAFGGDLPSAHSNTDDIPAVVSIVLTTMGSNVASSTFNITGSTFNITATITIDELVDVQMLNIAWLDSSGFGQINLNETAGNGTSELNPSGPVVRTLDLVFVNLRLSEADLYTFIATISETGTNTVTLERTYQVMTQIPSPEISVTSPGSSLEGGSITLTGTITLPASVDVNTTANATWIDENGVVITSGATLISTFQVNLTTHISTLTISSLSTENNGSMYSLMVTVYPVPSDTSHLIMSSNTTSSNEVIIEVAGLSLNIISSGSRVAGSTNFSITCTLSVTISLSSVTLSLVDSMGHDVVSTTNLTQATYDGIVFIPSILKASNAGEYMCVAMVQDTAGNNGSDIKTFNLFVEIGSLNVAVTDTTVDTVPGRYFVSTPLTLTCSVNVSEAVDIPNFSVTEAWTGPSGPIVSDNQNDSYIIAPATKVGNSNLYTSTLHISYLDMTESESDSGTYSCSLILNTDDPNIQPQETSGMDQFELTVEEPPTPEVTIVTTELPITGTNFSLICIVTTDKDLISELVVNWFTNGSLVMNTTTRTVLTLNGTSSKNVTLMFDPAVIADQGEYICTSVLTIPEATEQPEPVSEMISVGAIGAPEIDIMAVGSGVAGEQYSLVCEVTVGAKSPSVTWFHDGDEITKGVISSGSGITITLTLMFNPLNYSDVGEYTCVGILTISSINFTGVANMSTSIEVQIPKPLVSVATSSNGLLYQATQQSLFCNASFSNPLPPDGIEVEFQWKLEERIVTSNTRVAITNPSIMLSSFSTLTISTLTFSPINTTDSGSYTCNVIVTPVGSPASIISPDDQQGSTDINVAELPLPNVVITSVGNSTAGDNFTLTCALQNLIDNLVDMPILEWVDANISSTGMNPLDLLFNPLRTSDGGIVMCQWTLSTLGLDFYSQNSSNLTVNIPSFAVSVQTYPSDVTLYEETYIDLICDPSITEAVDTGVDISFTWTGPNGGSIDNGEGVYNVADQSDSSILRIERLSISRDDMAVYSCSVSVTPTSGSVYVVASESNIGDLTLNVIELPDLEFTVIVSIPDTPTAGDNFTFTCNVTGPERLVPIPTLSWEVEINESSLSLDTMDEAIIGDIVVIGNGAFSITLGFAPIKTSHAHRYSCDTFLSLPAGSVTRTGSGDLRVQISPPAVTVAVNPAVNPIYTSTALNLTCTAMLAEEVDTATVAMVRWIGPNSTSGTYDEQPTDPNRITVIPAVSVGDRMFESILVLFPVDIEVDNGLHTCQMTIQSDTGFSLEDGLIVTSSNSGNRTIVAEDLPSEIPIVNITASGSGEVGQSFNLTCSVTLVERMVVSPGIDYNITWMKIDDISQGEIGKDINITAVTVVGDPTTTVTLTFDPLRFGDRGTYMCMAKFNITTTLDEGDGADEYEIFVDVPPVAVEVSRDYGVPVYAGTNLTLICSTDLDENLFDIPIFLISSWTKNNNQVTIDSTHTEEQPSLVNLTLLTYAATYSFTPLDDKFNSMDSNDMGDNGTYQCDLTVTANVNDSFVRSRNGSSSSVNIAVQALPDPSVNIMVTGASIVGEALSLTCAVGVVDRLVVQPVIVWEKYASNELVSANNISVEPSRDGNNSTLSFTSLSTSDAGLYTCRAIVTIDSINVTVTAEDTQNITLQISSVVVNLTQSQEKLHVAGSSLILTADIFVDSSVDTPHSVSAVWDRNGSAPSSDERVTVLEVFSVPGINRYQTQIVFSTLSSVMDPGTYTCMVQVNSDSAYIYVANASAQSSTTINVNDPNVVLLTDIVEEFAEVETTCTYSEAFIGLNLTCTATKPIAVIPELRVTWLHDSSGIEGDAKYSSNNTMVTRTLTLNPTDFIDKNYTCLAEILIPESPNITKSRVHEVIFKGSEYLLFQLKAIEFSECMNLTLQSSIVSLIRAQVTQVIQSQCPLCGFQERFITQSVLVCNEINTLVYKASIFSSAVHSDVNFLVSFIEKWVEKGANITVGESVVMFDPNFPVINSALSDLMCTQSSSPTSSPVPSLPLSDSLIIIICVVVVFAVLLLCIIFIVIFCCMKLRQKKQSSQFSQKCEEETVHYTFAAPIKLENSDNYEIGDKLATTADIGDKDSVEAVPDSNHLHVDQSDPVAKQYNSLRKDEYKFAEPIKPEEPDDFNDKFVNPIYAEQSSTATSTPSHD